MNEPKDEFSILDWVGYVIGVVVIGFILFILVWPLIDPTPDESSSLQQNLHHLARSSPEGPQR